MKAFPYFLVVAILAPLAGSSQGFTRKTYHDDTRRHLKEIYSVRDTLSNLLEGKYVSYFVNGQVESKGQFTNNETTGVWEFYYETGKLKMRGVLRQNMNQGHWEYFFENGQMSMEGGIDGVKRQGRWKMYYENGQVKEEGDYKDNKRTGYWKAYFEDGALKGDIDYKDDFGRYTEYYRDGKVFGEGPRMGARNVGHWRYFNSDATLQSEGDYENGAKSGEWTYYHADGTVAAKGLYQKDEREGTWEFFHPNGKLSSAGSYKDDQKQGYWQTLDNNGLKKSEVTYEQGVGKYKEYHSNGTVATTGNLVNEKREGVWQFFTEDGKLEGECEYTEGHGVYKGYYANGSLRTKGEMEDDKKVGTWEIYETDGKLSGYYRPIYDDKKLSNEIVALAGKSQHEKVEGRGKRFTYFDPRFNEYKGLIVGTNPIFMAAGRLPLAFEFYIENRLGHEFEFIGIRRPFFQNDQNIAPGKQYERGYSIAIKQKFYNPLKAGMWYFGHELRFTNMGHFTNITVPQIPGAVFTVSSVEQRIEYGPVLGYRILRRARGSGFTIDTFISYDIGYRGFDVDSDYESYFEDINQSGFSSSFHFGVNFGNLFSYR